MGKELYDTFFNQVRKLYREDRVKDGVFQAMMDVGLVNDGPVGDSDPQGDDPAAFPLPPIALDYRSEDEVVHSSTRRAVCKAPDIADAMHRSQSRWKQIHPR